LILFFFYKHQTFNNHNRLSEPGTIWSAARGGTVQQFITAAEKLKSKNEKLEDQAGPHYKETVLHIACLHSNTLVALHIAENYTDLILKEYGDIYKGIAFLFFFFSKRNMKY